MAKFVRTRWSKLKKEVESRFAKSVAVGISLLLYAFFESYAAIRWLSLVVVAILAVWILAARYAGRKFDEFNQEQPRVAA